MATTRELEELVGHGVAVVVATRDADLRPEVGRGWGPVLDGTTLTVCVEAPPDSPMASNLRAGSPAAITLARLSARAAVQVKGPVIDVAEPSPERLAAVDLHIDTFVTETAGVGVPEHLARGFVASSLLSFTIEVEQQLEGAPGPDTGRPL